MLPNSEEDRQYLISKDKNIEPDADVTISVGWKRMPLESLPSRGMFLNEGSVIEFRPISVPEIKTYSALNDSDLVSINSAIKTVIKSCVKIKGGPAVLDGLSLSNTDKLYMLFAIRDLTMTEWGKENKMYVNAKCTVPGCGRSVKKEITHDIFGYYDFPDSLMKYYSPSHRAFVINHETFSSPIIARPPTVGITDAITRYVLYKEREKQNNTGEGWYDKDALSIAEFMMTTHVGVSNDVIDSKIKDIINWDGVTKYQAALKLKELMMEGVKPTVTISCKKDVAGCDSEGGTWEAPIRFRYSGVFDINNIVGELF